MDWINLVLWPAMVVSVIAAGLIGARSPHRRHPGFWVFLVSNLLWIAWEIHDGAYALVALQLTLGTLNVRGLFKTEV